MVLLPDPIYEVYGEPSQDRHDQEPPGQAWHADPRRFALLRNLHRLRGESVLLGLAQARARDGDGLGERL